MNLKARIEKIEAKLDLSDTTDVDLEGRFPDWTKEDIAKYAITGIKPEGKTFGHVSDRAYNHSKGMFDGWTNEDLTRYALTGEKPQKPAPSAH